MNLIFDISLYSNVDYTTVCDKIQLEKNCPYSKSLLSKVCASLWVSSDITNDMRFTARIPTNF